MWLRHSASKLALQEDQRAMYGIAVGGYQFIVIATNQFLVRKVGITSFRSRDRQVITQRIGAIAVQYIARPDHITPAARGFCPTHRHELICRYAVWQVAIAIANQHGRPDNCVERDVVLTDKVV